MKENNVSMFDLDDFAKEYNLTPEEIEKFKNRKEYELRLESHPNFKKMTLSELALMMLNPNEIELFRDYARIEYMRRNRNVGMLTEDFLSLDGQDKIMQERGYDKNSYLFSDSVDMQQLMQAYFTDEYVKKFLVFSEKHLAGTWDYRSKFFNKICDSEKENIENRLKESITPGEKELLTAFKNAIDLRSTRQEVTKRQIEDTTDKLLFNDALISLDSYTPLEVGSNYSTEEEYKLYCSRIKKMNYKLLEFLNDSIFDLDFLQYLYGMHKVMQDSRKLAQQKRKLLYEARNGFRVDYETGEMQEAFKLIRTLK